jgi:cytochrome c oxidase cbb3-type subunit 4
MIDEGFVRGGIAVLSLATFLGICWWAYRPKSRTRFEQDALLVFDEAEKANERIGRASGKGRMGRGASA